MKTVFRSICAVGIACLALSVSAVGNKPYKVTTSATSGGMITPRVANPHEGATSDFSIRPNAGYRVVSVQGCGGTYNATTFTYTTAPADADCTVRASFHAGLNQVPVVNPGQDITVNVGDTVTLTGTATDADGSIASTGWTQTAGTPVVLTNYGSTATFVASQVTGATPLVFTFTATDNELATATGSIHVTVIDTLSLVFFDEFDDGVDDLTKWDFQGYRGWVNEITAHTETNGVLTIRMDVTDQGAMIRTRGLPQLTKAKVVMRHYMHAANNYYFPGISFGLTSPTEGFGLSIERTNYSQGFCDSGANYGKVIITGPNHQKCSEQQFVSNISSASLYDRWIISSIEYDTTTGKFDYDLDNDGTVDFRAVLPEHLRLPITSLVFGTYGWFTGHFHSFDYIRIYGR